MSPASPRWRRAARLLVLPVMLAGCAPPRTLYRPPSEALIGREGDVIVQRRDGTRIRVREASVARDTLRGLAPETGHAVRIAVVDIDQMSGTEPVMSRAGYGAIAAGALTIFLLTAAQNLFTW